MAVSKRLRYEVLRRDNHACRYCGATAPGSKLTTDHVIPVALGGSDLPDNLVAACVDCNAGKTSSNPDAPLVDDVKADALRWARAMREAARLVGRDARDRRDLREMFESVWNEWTYEAPDGRAAWPLPSDWPLTIDRLADADFNPFWIPNAVEAAMLPRHVRDRFKYFCGVTRAMLRKQQDYAQQILAQADSGGV
jgi:HNH endonuclease